MERQPYGTNGVFKTRRVPYRTTKKLRRSYKVSGNGTRKHEEPIQQEMKKPSRIKGWGQYVAGEQKYPFKQTVMT